MSIVIGTHCECTSLYIHHIDRCRVVDGYCYVREICGCFFIIYRANRLPAETTIAILNKQDLDEKINKEYIYNKFKHIVCMQAADGTGREELERAVAEVTGVHRLDEAEPILATERQRLCVFRAEQGVREALDALQSGMTLDAVSVSVDSAISAVLELTGERTTEAVVDGIFARFCVGK